MQKAAQFSFKASDKQVPVRVQSFDNLNAILLYEVKNHKTDSLLDKNYLIAIQNAENVVRKTKNWENLCFAQSVSDSNCNAQ